MIMLACFKNIIFIIATGHQITKDHAHWRNECIASDY